jgi:cytochrome c
MKGTVSMKHALTLLVALSFGAGAACAADAPADMLKSKGCLGCHDIDKKKVGPAYKDVAAKYKGDAGASAKIVGELKEGKGHPVKVKASDEELKSLADYVLSLK